MVKTNKNSFHVCFTAFLALCELPQSGRKFGFSHELPDLAHLTLLDGPIGFNEIGQRCPITLTGDRRHHSHRHISFKLYEYTFKLPLAT